MSTASAQKRLNAIVQHVRLSASPSPTPIPTALAVAVGTCDAKSPFDFSTLQNVTVEKKGRVGIVTMNRPNALNALSDALVTDLSVAIGALQADNGIGCIILTGAGRAFAAGADITEFRDSSYLRMSTRDKLAAWKSLAESKLPMIAAVNGLALGGGCELALMCDIVIAADTARFGQPEIKLGILPGAGGTQRLPRFVGKSKAMEMCLTGEPITAADAEKFGLASRVVPADQLLPVALKMATTIANYPRPAVQLVKDSVNTAFETTLATGLQYERRLFHMTWGYDDAREGTRAFVEKRPAKFQHK